MSFPIPTVAAWRSRVETELEGIPLSRLERTTADGIAIEPLFLDGPGEAETGLPGAAPFVRGARPIDSAESWWIAQRTDAVDPVLANRDLLEDLRGGSNAIRLEPPATVEPSIWLARALDEVVLDAIAIVLELGGDPRPWVAALDALAAARGLDPAGLALSVTSATPELLEAEVLRDLLGRPAAGRFRATSANAIWAHDLGATPADELGVAIAAAAELLRAAERSGIAPARAAARISLRLAVGPEVFPGIAKLRAARRLWSLLLTACGIDAADRPAPFLDVGTSKRALTRRDPWVNLMRGTNECFAALCGGADAIEVWPLDARLGHPGAFGRRLARNTQLVLAEEGGIGRVLDPAGGSYFLESHTEQLARHGWLAASAIESMGGYSAALASGALQERFDAAWKNERKAVRTRRRAITGVSEYAQLDEVLVPGTERSEEPAADSLRAVAADFEALRDAAELLSPRPRVFLATLGAAVDFGPRAAFLTNLLSAGGIEAIVDAGSAALSPEAAGVALAERLVASGAELVCLCGTDGAYMSHGVAVAQALAACRPRRLLLAGRPRDLEVSLRAAGIDRFVAFGDDVVVVLADLLEAAGATIPAEVVR